MSPLVRTFGKYLLDEEIARGGMSRVYLARLRGLGGFEKKLVVKQVLPELARDPRFVAMFVHEAKTVVQMSHPHIAPVYELGVVDGVYFLAMEYVEGATLAEIVRHGPLAPELAAHVGAEVCDALHYAHTRFDVIHRDVTPRNVIVDSGGHSRLLDFGIAAPVTADERELFGTPGYLAPEHLRGEPLGATVDVFSLGVVLFEAITGRRAFDVRTVDEARAAFERDDLGRFEPRDGDLPAPLRTAIERAMAREPAERFATARDFGRTLRGWLASTRPEGVAPELGARAEEAESKRTARSPERESMPDREPTGEVRTLATSQLLDALIAEHAPNEGEGPSTVALERRSLPVAAPTTAMLERPAAHSSTPQPPERHERRSVAGEETDPAVLSPPARRGIAVPIAFVAGALAIAATVFAVVQPDAPTRRVRRDPVVAQAPVEPVPIPPPVVEPPVPVEVPAIETPPDPLPAPAVVNATLSINASPWAEIRLDGRAVGRTPQRRVSVRPGRHTVVLSCPPLGRDVRHSFEATAGDALTLVADLNADPPTVRFQ